MLKVFVIFYLCSSFVVHCDDRFVTILAPKVIHEGSPYSLFVLPTNLNSGSKAAFEIRGENVHVNFQNSHYSKVDFRNHKLFGKKAEFNFKFTLYDSDTCYTKDADVKATQRTFYIFIQTDKPVYKPGDNVRFRVLVVDQDLKPFHMNNIQVAFVDPADRVIQTFDDLSDQNIGLFEEKFLLSSETILGDWKIKVTVDKNEDLTTSKKFSVSKYTLPLFDVDVSTSDKNVLRNSDVTISFHAKYSFGQFVNGSAELTIKNAQSGRTYLTEKFTNIQDVKRIVYNVARDLKVEDGDVQNLEATVSFLEPESKISFSKSTRFYVHSTPKHKIIAIHPEKFTPGSKFGLMVKVNDWKDNSVLNATSKVELKYSYTLSSGSDSIKSALLVLENGIASHEFTIPLNAVAINLELKFENSQVYKKTIEAGSISSGSDGIVVDYYPKSPKLNENVKIYVKGVSYMQNILAVMMTKSGIIDHRTVYCNNQNCHFDMKVKVPHSTVVVFHVKDGQHVYRGSTKIVTTELGMNNLKFSMSKSQAKPKDRVKMNFLAQKKSKIYLLGFDKRLKSLGNENDITQQDIVEKMEKYENKFKILIIPKSSFRECTDVEYSLLGVTNWRRIEEERRLREHQRYIEEEQRRQAEHERNRVESEMRPQMSFTRSFGSSGGILRNFALASHSVSNYPEYSPQATTYRPPIRQSPSAPLGPDEDPLVIDEKDDETQAAFDNILRDNFQETWIFDTINVESDGNIEKEFKTPDAITNWQISAFSVSKEQGISIAAPLELTVKNDFFIKMSLPYSIRHQEVLRLDILVYNYIDSKELLNANVKLENLNNFEIAEADPSGANCQATFSAPRFSSKGLTVPHMAIKKVSFYIRSNSNDTDFSKNFFKTLKIQVQATGTDKNGKVYTDLVQKELLIEPVGIKSFKIFSDAYLMNGGTTNPNTYSFSADKDFSTINAIISGDYLTDTKDLDSRFGYAEPNALIHKTSKLKKHAEYFRYLKEKGKNPPNKHIIHYYQSLLQERIAKWSYSNSTVYRAYFIDTLASAMEIGAIPPHILLVRAELDFLKTQQTDEGDFEKAGSFSMLKRDVSRPETDRYFETAYSLLPILKYRTFMGNDLSVYIIIDIGAYYLIIHNVPDYSGVIDKAFSFLNSNQNKRNVENDGLSIAAYAYALNGSTTRAAELLREFENDSLDQGNNRKCMKVKKNYATCDMQHTAYTALTYLKLENIEKVKPLINWLVNELNRNYFDSYTHEYVIAMEAVAKSVKYLNNDNLDLTVNIKNERNFEKVVKLVKATADKPQNVQLPQFTQNVISQVSGKGFGSVTTISESIVKLPRLSTEFSLTANPISNSGGYKVKTVRICGKYTKPNGSILTNVIYEVEIPSGYIYTEIADADEKMKDIKLIEEKRDGTLVFFYFDEFEPSKEYCVDIKVTKMFDVSHSSKAGVKAYDYYKKENVAISFYNFVETGC